MLKLEGSSFWKSLLLSHYFCNVFHMLAVWRNISIQINTDLYHSLNGPDFLTVLTLSSFMPAVGITCCDRFSYSCVSRRGRKCSKIYFSLNNSNFLCTKKKKATIQCQFKILSLPLEPGNHHICCLHLNSSTA